MAIFTSRPQAVRITPAQRQRRAQVRAALRNIGFAAVVVLGAASVYAGLVLLMGADAMIR